jgi:hypothetical protein
MGAVKGKGAGMRNESVTELETLVSPAWTTDDKATYRA